MIIGALALLSLLFGGGNEIFFIEKLEKGIKEYVVEKDRQKDILADVKTTKKFVEQYNKGRKTQIKEFKELYKNQATNDEALNAFYDVLHKERIVFQDEIIDYRLAIFNKIEEDEWNNIVEYSEASIDKKIEKAQKKKKNKNEVAFKKTRKAVISSLSDMNKQKVLIDGLDTMINSFEELGLKINSINVKESHVISKKGATKEELKKLMDEMNDLRNLSFDQLLTFRNLIKENSNEVAWNTIIKAFSKELTLSPR